METGFAFYNRIKVFCRQKELFAQGDRVLLGLSGGADSVCLFLVLLTLAKEWDLTLCPVHVNHNLRGEEALRDRDFCRELCRQHHLELVEVSAEVAALAAQQGWTLEEAGRKVRYEAFEEIAQNRQCNKVAVAHHKDDQAETVLFQMFRGSRLKGLSGMEAKNGSLVRPLLCVTREEIEQYLKENRQEYCIDSTNLEEQYTRNKLRHRIIPEAENICAGAVEHIVCLADYAGQVEKLLQRLTEELFVLSAVVDGNGSVSLKIEALRSAERVLAERVVYEALGRVFGEKKDITSAFVADCMELMEKQTGKGITLPSGVVARRNFDVLRIEKETPKETPEEFFWEITEFPFSVSLPELGKKITLLLKNREELEENIPKSTYTKWFDYDKIYEVVSLRRPTAEDELIIYTDGRKKRLTDIFAQARVPREQRKHYPVLAAGDTVLWVPKIRGSEGYRVTKETKQVLIATIDGGNENGR